MKKLLLLLVTAMLALVGCTMTDQSLATPVSMCGYLIGNGGGDVNDPHNRTVNEIIPPGSTIKYKSEYDNSMYFPCGPRNYVIAAQGGDTQRPLLARTSDGTQVYVYTSTYWTPNQNTKDSGLGEPLKNFILFCEKYACASADVNASANGQNSSTPGWNKMLEENMWPTLQRVSESATVNVADDVWITDNRALKDKIGEQMSLQFADEMRKVSGFATDLMCGSGDNGSGSNFDCRQVRVVVDRVVAAQPGRQDQAEQSAAQSAQVADQAKRAQDWINLTNQLYGPLAEEFRACHDTPGCVWVRGAEVKLDK